MGHGWASDVALSNIHERYLFSSLFHFIQEHTSKYGFTIRMHLSSTSKLGYFKTATPLGLFRLPKATYQVNSMCQWKPQDHMTHTYSNYP